MLHDFAQVSRDLPEAIDAETVRAPVAASGGRGALAIVRMDVTCRANSSGTQPRDQRKRELADGRTGRVNVNQLAFGDSAEGQGHGQVG